MYPDRTTPPPQIKGDFAPSKMGEGLLIFVLGVMIVAFFTLVLVRAYTIHMYKSMAQVSLLNFFHVFFQHWLNTPFSFIFVCSIIFLLGFICVVGAGWMGVLTSRPAGGDLGVRWLVGPVLQKLPPPFKKNEKVGKIRITFKIT